MVMGDRELITHIHNWTVEPKKGKGGFTISDTSSQGLAYGVGTVTYTATPWPGTVTVGAGPLAGTVRAGCFWPRAEEDNSYRQ